MFIQNWIDTHLIWNASDFKEKSWIQFERVGMHQLIWTPQIRLLKYGRKN